MRVFYLGVDPDFPLYLQRKIILSNQIGPLIGAAIAFPFVIISLIYFKPLTLLAVGGTVFGFSPWLFNFLGLYNLSRIIVSVLPSTLACIYAAYLNHAGEAALPGVAMLELCFVFVIFLVIDIRETKLLIGIGLYVCSLMVFMDFLNSIFEVELDTTVIETGWLAKVSVVLSLLVGGASILFLVKLNQTAENRAQELLDQAEQSRHAMISKEADLKEHLRKLNEVREEEAKRQWASEGLSKINKIIRDHRDLNVLCVDLLSTIVKYLKANQGGLFIVNETNTKDVFLELRSAYAYERKKYLQKRIGIGEGLLGQAYLEGQYIYLKQIPEEYIHITSGLGMANPRSLILMPMKINDEILGVIELASFSEFGAHEIDFLDSVGEILASTIQSRKADELTHELIETLKTKTEQMRSQEEEMMQNMEELSATQEEMERKEKEYLLRIEQLEKSISVMN